MSACTHTHLRVDVRDLFDRTTLACAPVLGGYDAAVGALAELLDELVLRVDYEGRVESGEGVPLHGLCPVERDGRRTRGQKKESVV